MVVINKPSGTLTLAGTIRTAANWTYSAGSLSTAGSTLVFIVDLMGLDRKDTGQVDEEIPGG